MGAKPEDIEPGFDSFNRDEEFYRAINPKAHLRNDGQLSSNAFQNTSHTNGMSVDWATRSTPKKTRDRMGYKIEFVAAISAGLCYDSQQRIKYWPIEGDPAQVPPVAENRAHCEVIGHKATLIREALLAGCRLAYIADEP